MSVEERTAFWQAQADLRLGKKHLEILLSAWRAAEPALTAAGQVLDRRHVAWLNARFPRGPIPVGETSAFHPAHREAIDLATGREAAAIKKAFEDLLHAITEALSTPVSLQAVGDDHDGQHPDKPAA